MIDAGLNGKVALVTGGNNPYGIGAAVARGLAAQGVHIFIHYFRRQVDGSDSREMGEDFYWQQQQNTPAKLIEEIEQMGGRATMFEADLGDAAVPTQLFDAAEAELGPIEILVNNAARSDANTFVPQSILGDGGTAVDGTHMESLTAANHDKIFDTNTRATALMMAEFAKRHVARQATWGRIINISTDGAAGFRTQVSYGASKYAIESYSKAAAGELGQYGITVNVASLGPIQTGWIPADFEQVLAQNTPLGRVGTPEDVADVVVFLASEQARWLTGQVLFVGGGHRMPG